MKTMTLPDAAMRGIREIDTTVVKRIR